MLRGRHKCRCAGGFCNRHYERSKKALDVLERETDARGRKLVVNKREFEEYFSHENFAKQAYAPLLTVDLKEKIDVTVNVAGGGVSGQAGAVAHGIARALQKMNAELRPALKKAGHIKRDPREKERKKAGQPGARKRFQFSKR